MIISFKMYPWKKNFYNRRQHKMILLIVVLFILSTSIYWKIGNISLYEQPSKYKYNIIRPSRNEYLVWNSKCHIPSLDPLDSSIINFVGKLDNIPCPDNLRLTYISKDLKSNIVLVINQTIASKYDINCCWSPITRPSTKKPIDQNIDSKINVGECKVFSDKVILPTNLEAVSVKCDIKRGWLMSAMSTIKNIFYKQILYENVHPILDSQKVRKRLSTFKNSDDVIKRQKLSILFLGVDSVSRLNFVRSLPKTAKYIQDKGFITMKGYNKIGLNTFPNLMAILSGFNEDKISSMCNPQKIYGIDNCPIIWNNFRNIGYITSYGEDATEISTFTYLKAGFVEPPTDYYARPYMLASEKMLSVQRRFFSKYCTGSELSINRVFDYGIEFAKTFITKPYFGFFWTNTVSHNDVNGISIMDDHFLTRFKNLETSGVMNDSMIIFLSDHGMRFGKIRETFIGSYEDKMPFLHLRLPEWFRKKFPEAQMSLELNQNRLTSPYDLYMTLRDILKRAGGETAADFGCPSCNSLFYPVPIDRGCDDAGILPHYCNCISNIPQSINDQIAINGANSFIQYVEQIIKDYKNRNGKRLCAKLHLKKIHRFEEVIEESVTNSYLKKYLLTVELCPGGGQFELTFQYYGDNNYTFDRKEINRINLYGPFAGCLDTNDKKFCYCTNLMNNFYLVMLLIILCVYYIIIYMMKEKLKVFCYTKHLHFFWCIIPFFITLFYLILLYL